ncbi:hypothetical protein N9O57_01090 [bacterium]|nr:hypothetical protein [bacterium]
MKSFLTLSLLILSLASFAEVKPEGTILRSECGKVAGLGLISPNTVLEVCLAYDSSSDNNMFLVVETASKVDYYIVNLREWTPDGEKLNLTKAVISKKNGYPIWVGDSYEGLSYTAYVHNQKSSSFLSSGLNLSHFITGKLETIFHTQAL